ncbi:phosphoribosyltransferase [Pleurocapsa sp. FMAR1]|uniref:phosphoribosyltransferase n=1 Tax=Pleurocapsa sp. FMAR1 TaxID=3040204 RepID=UPI0029C7CAC3|nr:phosphoribosyltransferase family protein [Pleurocapsa sp. FMAR1]
MTDLHITWSEYHHKIETLAVKIHQSDWQFNQIVCLAKGGLRVGDILCRLYDQPLAILSTASYGGENNQQRGQIKFSEHLATIQPLDNRILLVDDLVDSGVSLAESLNWLQTNYGANIAEIRTAVIWYKSTSIKIPDYYVDYLPDNPWIHQPFEKYEQTNIISLAAQFNKVKIK